MKINIYGTTIVEAIIVMVIVLTGVVGTFSIYDRSSKLAESTDNKLEAIGIAREGIEMISNIRDTNQSLFAANTPECWLVKDYDSNCIAATDKAKLYSSGSYIITSSGSVGRFTLSGAITGNFNQTDYQNAFRVNKTTDGFYIQGSGSTFKPLYTREIQLSYTGADTNEIDSKQQAIIKSIVRRTDSAKTTGNYEITFDTLLTNWK